MGSRPCSVDSPCRIGRFVELFDGQVIEFFGFTDRGPELASELEIFFIQPPDELVPVSGDILGVAHGGIHVTGFHAGPTAGAGFQVVFYRSGEFAAEAVLTVPTECGCPWSLTSS
jgi:hypothetical protein